MNVPLTLALCSNRTDLLPRAAERLRRTLGRQDHLIVVVDAPVKHQAPWPITPPTHDRVRILFNGSNIGLSYSRNLAMKEATTQHLVFLDDDIAPTPQAIAGLRAAFGNGAHVVGTRITADFQGRPVPWYLSPGQLHYLGSHAPDQPIGIWGGCLGIDLDLVRHLGTSFDERLGRVGQALISAEDTTFVRALVSAGAISHVLDDIEVAHQIPPHRLRMGYLLRRAHGQGRSEVRRGASRQGLAKEWRRNLGDAPYTPRRIALGLLYTAAVILGEAHEAAQTILLSARRA